MREDELVDQMLDEINNAVPADYDVRTPGGDQDALPPVIVVDWNATRLANANGHNTKGGYTTDGSGNKTGIEHHTYWGMEADCIVRSYSENERDTILNTVQSAFIPYEKNSTAFDSDTREWEIGSSGPRNNPVLEPDWYESGILVQFEYVKRTDETGKDTIQDIEYDIQVTETPHTDGGYGISEYGSNYGQ